MKYLFFSCIIRAVLLSFLFFNATNLTAQKSLFSEDIDFKIKTIGKLLSPSKLIVVVELDIPEGWKLRVDNGYGSIWQDGLDTVDMTLKFGTSTNYQIIDRLKADRKPAADGCYHENVTFVQTLQINSTNVPLFIDAELKLSLMRKDNKDFVKIKPCCLLQVCQKRSAAKTLKVGWDCEGRAKVYLEDIMD
jgi:hypothetical protein